MATVDWLTTQLPAKSKFQVYAFNTKARPLVPDSDGKWLDGSDAEALNDVLTALRQTVPKDGTSLENAFARSKALIAAPDNVILITDGLPTQGASAPLDHARPSTATTGSSCSSGAGQVARRRAGQRDPAADGGRSVAPAAFWTLARRHERLVPEAGEGLAMRAAARPRDFEVFSLSFLDTICCGFGAVILLFVLSKFGEPVALEKSREDLEGQLSQAAAGAATRSAARPRCSIAISRRASASCRRRSASSRGCAAT